MNKGWVKFHREQWKHWVSDDKPYCRGYAWTYIYSNANHKDNKVCVNGRLIMVRRGQLLTSIAKLAEKWRWSRHKVSDFLFYLESDKMIKQRRTSKYTLITIVNYDFYQFIEGQRDIRRTSKRHQKDTNKNGKNEKKADSNPLTNLSDI